LNLRNQLTDVVRQVAPLFKKIKVTGDADSTKIEAMDDDKILFLNATLKQPVPEFIGEFGIGSLSLLSGLLNFASYKTDDAKLLVHRSEVGDHVGEFEFRDKRGGFTRFKTMNPRLVEQPQIANIKWHVTVAPTKATVTELSQLASHLSEVDSMFGVMVENHTLFVTIGGGASGTHTSSVALATEVEEAFSAPSATYNTKHLLSVLKNAGPNPSEVRFSERGVAGITVETEYGTYNYFLRAKPI
jgi:hypothetical protein